MRRNQNADLCHLTQTQTKLGAAGELEVERVGVRVDGSDLCGGAVAQWSVVWVGDRVADLDMVAWVQPVGAPGYGKTVGAELPGLVADGLGAGVERV